MASGYWGIEPGTLDSHDQTLTIVLPPPHDDKDMAPVINLTFSKVITDESNAVITSLLNIFQGSDEVKFTITEIYAHEVRIFFFFFCVRLGWSVSTR